MAIAADDRSTCTSTSQRALGTPLARSSRVNGPDRSGTSEAREMDGEPNGVLGTDARRAGGVETLGSGRLSLPDWLPPEPAHSVMRLPSSLLGLRGLIWALVLSGTPDAMTASLGPSRRGFGRSDRRRCGHREASPDAPTDGTPDAYVTPYTATTVTTRSVNTELTPDDGVYHVEASLASFNNYQTCDRFSTQETPLCSRSCRRFPRSRHL